MQARTYTSLWRVERRIYRIYDVNLPYAVTVRQIGVFAGIVAIWIPIMLLFRIPANTSFGFVAWVGPPILLAYLSNRPLAENKTLTELLFSEVKFRLSSALTHRLQPVPKGAVGVKTLTAVPWTRHVPGPSEETETSTSRGFLRLRRQRR